jgi:hypothetical protein
MTKRQTIKEGSMNNLKIFCLLFGLGLMLSCASSTGPISYNSTRGGQPGKFLAAKYEEVELATLKGDFYKGKILSLAEGKIEFRPSPYWGVEPIRLELGEIRSIGLVNKPKRAGKGFLQGFGWTFTIVGGLAAAGSKYDEDYQAGLYGSAIVGLAGGAIGFLVGAIQDSAAKARFDFGPMSASEKEQAVRKIMGSRKGDERGSGRRK